MASRDLIDTLRGHKVPGINLRALYCCLTLKFFYAFRNTNLLHMRKKNRYKSQKVSEIWDFASIWLTKMVITRSIFEIQGSFFGFSLIFMCVIIHILQLSGDINKKNGKKKTLQILHFHFHFHFHYNHTMFLGKKFWSGCNIYRVLGWVIDRHHTWIILNLTFIEIIRIQLIITQ